MNASLRNLFLGVLVAVTGAASATAETQPATHRQATAAWASEGMQPVRNSGLDLVYARPGADLSAYRKARIAPVQVSFRHGWERTAGTPIGTRIKTRDVTRIKNDLAREVRWQVVRELRKGGYEVVEHGGPDVLDITVRVTELYLNAPDIQTANVTRSYTQSFGEMNLIADVHDPVSGQPVLHVLDRSMGWDLGYMRITTRVENTRDVGMAAGTWARALRRELAARSAGGRSS